MSESTAWSKRADDEDGIQTALLISRNDNVINMCEIKYYGDDFTVSKDYYRVLLRCQEVLAREVSSKVVVHNTLVTTFGLVQNKYSSIFSNVITLDDLCA